MIFLKVKTYIFLFFLFFISSIIMELNDFRPPNSSDDLKLLFCLYPSFMFVGYLLISLVVVNLWLQPIPNHSTRETKKTYFKNIIYLVNLQISKLHIHMYCIYIYSIYIVTRVAFGIV